MEQRYHKLKHRLAALPAWLFTIITVAVIMWLTLAPHPLGDDEPKLFEGADKVAHALMFGFLTCMVLLDIERRRGWHPVGTTTVIAVVAIVIAFGIAIEFIQLKMDMGRGFETADMLADAIGAVVFGTGWILIRFSHAKTEV